MSRKAALKHLLTDVMELTEDDKPYIMVVNHFGCRSTSDLIRLDPGDFKGQFNYQAPTATSAIATQLSKAEYNQLIDLQDYIRGNNRDPKFDWMAVTADDFILFRDNALVARPNGTTTTKATAVEELALHNNDRGIKRVLEILEKQEANRRPTPSLTPSHFGFNTLQELKTANSVSELSGGGLDEPALLYKDELESLALLKNEHQIVAFMTTVFERILDGLGIQVVNSEEYPWLVTSDDTTRFNKKPDHIFCHIGICNRRPAFQTADSVLLGLRNEKFMYGALADWGLRDSIDVVGEAKMKINNNAIGEMANYVQHLQFGSDGPRRSKLLLYDTKEFWMMKAVGGIIASVEIGRWDTPGMQPALRDFIHLGRSPWIILLMAAAQFWNVEIDSFLGKGANGRVFKVSSREPGRIRFMALKIVLPGEHGHGNMYLLKERECLAAAASILPGGVARVEAWHDFGGKGAALLLADVGGKVPKQAWQQLFESLGRLHEGGMLHRDPRLANAIFVQGAVQWIDFQSSFVAAAVTDDMKRRDLLCLAKSCFPNVAGADAIVMQYSGTASSAAMVYRQFTAADCSGGISTTTHDEDALDGEPFWRVNT